MAVTLQGSGSQACTVGTEHTLLDIAIAGVFDIELDLSPSQAGDRFEIRCYTILLTGGTRHPLYMQPYSDVQPADAKHVIGVPVPNDLTDSGSVRFTLKQTNGTSRTIDWKVLKLG